MICIDCGAPVRANAKRCTSCAASAGMAFFRLPERPYIPVVRTPGICRRSNCNKEVVQKRGGPKKVYCCQSCKKADVAMRERARRGDEGRAKHAEYNRIHRQRLREAREAQKAREMAERVERINAKARQMMAA